jgi:hypothetical protein
MQNKRASQVSDLCSVEPELRQREGNNVYIRCVTTIVVSKIMIQVCMRFGFDVLSLSLNR